MLPGGIPAGRPERVREGDADHHRLVVDASAFRSTLGVRAPEAVLLAGDPGLAEVELERGLFLDLETTGLSRGAGTVAFVVGWARFEGASLEVHQRVLRRRRAEREVLGELDAEVRRASVLVTFNGKSFDRDLLSVRYAMSGLDDRALLSAPHLDLLHPARRLLRGVLPTCDLRSLESSLLGVRRTDDVPGDRIPGIYRDFLHTGDADLLEPVVRHNAGDLLSLVALAGVLAERVRAVDPEALDAAVVFEAGRLHGVRGSADEALRLLGAAGRAGDAAVAYRAQRERSLLLKRLGRIVEARAHWAAMRESCRGLDPFPFEELAKDAEHRRSDPAAALEVVESWLSGGGPSASPESVPEFLHRRDRLARRVGGPVAGPSAAREG